MLGAVALTAALVLAPTAPPRFSDTAGLDSTVLLARGLPAPAYAAADWWNDTAGATIFRTARASETPHIHTEVVAADHAWITVTPGGYDEPYTTCTVHAANNAVGLWLHELGHCLGFADSLRADDWDGWAEQGYAMGGATVCDDEAHPAYSAYVGVMSYCLSPRDITGDDVCGLMEAGYLTAREYARTLTGWSKLGAC